MADSGILNIIAHGGPLQTVPQNEEVQNQANLAAAQAKEARARIPTLQEQAKQAVQTTQANAIAARDQQILSGLMTQSEGDFDKMLKLAPRSGASPSAVFGLQKTVMDAKKQALDNTIEQNKVHADLYDRLRGSLASSLSAQDPNEKQAGWDALKSHVAELPPEVQQLIKPEYPGDQQAQLIDHLLAGGTKITKEALETQQAAEAAGKGKQATAAAQKDLAEIPGIQLKAEQEKRQQAATTLAAAASQGPEALQAAMDELPHGVAKIFQGKTKPADILALGITPVEAVTAQREQQTADEAARAHRAQEAIEKGRLGIEASRNARENKIYEQTYGEGSNEALRGVEPKLRVQATAAAQKAANDAIKANRAADEMEHFINEARAGNKAAYANIPVAGVLEITTSNGTTRINKNELEAYQHAGSGFDKLAGLVGKTFTGASIDKSVMNDIEALHKGIREGADRAYDQQIEAVNQNYHSGFKRVPGVGKSAATQIPEGVKNVLGGSGVAPGVHTLSDGSKWRKAANGTITPL